MIRAGGPEIGREVNVSDDTVRRLLDLPASCEILHAAEQPDGQLLVVFTPATPQDRSLP